MNFVLLRCFLNLNLFIRCLFCLGNWIISLFWWYSVYLFCVFLTILALLVAIGKNYVSSSTEKEDPSHMKNQKKIIQNILKREGSAAALWYRMKNQPETQASDRILTKDVIGMVATLGMVDDDNLSRWLQFFSNLSLFPSCKCITGSNFYMGVLTNSYVWY